MLRYLSR